MLAAWEFSEMLQEIIDKGMYLPPGRFLMWMRQDCTKRDATEAPSVRKKFDARL